MLPPMPARLAILSLLAFGCQDPPEPARVAIVGIDGGDWDVLDPLIATGRLPNLARLRQQGATAAMDVDSGKSPESWTTLASGHPREKHGVWVPDGPFDDPVVPPANVRVKRLWDIAGKHDRRALVVDWWVTWPPYPISGVMVSRDCPLCQGTFASCPDNAVQQRGAPITPDSGREEMERLELLADDSTAVMRGWLDEPFDLAMLPYYGLDAALHNLWSDYQAVAGSEDLSVLDEQERARVKQGYEIVVDAAELADALLGEAMTWSGPDGFVLVVSDHGHTGREDTLRHLTLSRSLIDGKKGTTTRGTFNVDGQRVVISARQRRVASAVTGAGYLFRYPVVEVAPDALKARLLATTARDGQPLFVEASGFLLPSPELQRTVHTAVGGHVESAFSVYVNSGEHPRDEAGIFGLLGPGVAPGPLEGPVRSVDVAPTALWLMGLPVGKDMAGQPVVEALRSAERKRVLTVATHEDGERPWAVDAPRPEVPHERLKALGYVQ